MAGKINIKNKKASFEFELLDVFSAGIVLTGTEIKSIRSGKVSFVDPFCIIKDREIWVKGIHIAEYENGGYQNHEPKRDRKLLLNRKEINKIEKKIKDKGFTVVPIRIFIDENGHAKLEIALARGKKQFDKRESLKKQDAKLEMSRQGKRNL
ncbi:MAG: SsrA-binding protein [Bacteroidetes bacterium RIFOXYA12_FULL_35_11]|nr:MAG: SsrA-binding protein [Bacteroidetes bacterium GWF2_35_48]OFY73173.1 MAG: SsrA-binding protein [Bacteroidetes bacterium RIFOXYA12_FULL_35_11]OFZ01272.1 MAG: SsrA-binding protein [Bacteroidetes bacterium RIFOXYC12_FULL_35_7]HBX50927.1 SsrA-binding protein [Bacteroidales bacterium]